MAKYGDFQVILTSFALHSVRLVLKPLPMWLSMTLSQGAQGDDYCTQCFLGMHTPAARRSGLSISLVLP